MDHLGTNGIKNPDPDFDTLKGLVGNARAEIIKNVIQSRASLISRFLDPKRDIDGECGHPADPPDLEAYHRTYVRDPIARRVCQVLPRECWQVQPTVYETEDPKQETPFEKAWKELPKELSGRKSWFRDETGSKVWEVLRRADIMCGVGSYGVILIGLEGPLDQPIQPLPSGQLRKLLYLRVFSEYSARVQTREDNKSSPRYGQPLTYSVRLNNPNDDTFREESPLQGAVFFDQTEEDVEVHWSRVVHIVDNVDESEVHGTPRMLPPWNNLLDLRKLYGGSAEMYWRGAFPGISFETHPTLGDDPDIDLDQTKESVENYFLGLQRYFGLIGMTAKSLAPQVVDPTPQILAQIQAICIVLGIPMRVFMGSERGELASSQDDEAWNDRLRERQHGQISPRVISPFVDHLIWVSVLPEPEGYSISWPDLTSQTTQQKSQVAFQRTQALTQYHSSGAEVDFPPMEYFTLILGLDEKEALAVTKAAKLHRTEVDKREADKKQADFDLQLEQKEKQMELENKLQPPVPPTTPPPNQSPGAVNKGDPKAASPPTKPPIKGLA